MATATPETKAKKAKVQATAGALGRRTLRKLGREKRKLKLVADKEFAKTFFAAKSKRSADKKVTFRKKKVKKA